MREPVAWGQAHVDSWRHDVARVADPRREAGYVHAAGGIMKLTRKEFLGAAGAALLVGCGGSDGPGDGAAANCLANGTAVTISGNHGHVLTVAKADVMAGTMKMYDIAGGAGHSHMVTI